MLGVTNSVRVGAHWQPGVDHPHAHNHHRVVDRQYMIDRHHRDSSRWISRIVYTSTWVITLFPLLAYHNQFNADAPDVGSRHGVDCSVGKNWVGGSHTVGGGWTAGRRPGADAG
jgi:hypothetical protein